MASNSANRRLASLLLGQPVEDWIHERRDEGLSWRLVTRALMQRTNGQVDVTHETVRAWADQSERAADATCRRTGIAR